MKHRDPQVLLATKLQSRVMNYGPNIHPHTYTRTPLFFLIRTLVLVNVIRQAADGHELGRRLHVGARSHPKQTRRVQVIHAGQHHGLLRGKKKKNPE